MKSSVNFIEYSNLEYSEYSAVALDYDRNVLCWIISEFNQANEKMKYIAVNHQGKAIFPPDENLANVKKQITGLSREKREQEIQSIRQKKTKSKGLER